MNNLADINNAIINISLLTVYKNFLCDDVCVKFIVLLEAIKENEEFAKVIELYTDFISELYRSEFKGDWSSYVRNFVLSDNNPVSIECAGNNSSNIPTFILGAFEYELRILSDIASIKFEDIREVLFAHFPLAKDAINSIPSFDSYKLLFTKDQIQESYKKEGYGVISKYSAFKYSYDEMLKPVITPDDITLDSLKLYDYQKNILKDNTLAFLNGKKANNILLYGDRGCGKSSSVKAIANEYKNLGLKIIQIYKDDISSLEALCEYLANFPSKFIIFIDDLVFDENDSEFSSAKAVLEGSLAKHPDNILIYATTNRRHLIKETFLAREGNEVHLNDTMDEAASLSDRFGITITFSSPDKKNYLEIVKQLAAELNIKEDEETLFKKAEAFALLKGNRAPRIARQFLTAYQANTLN